MREIAVALPTHPLPRSPGVAIMLGVLVGVFGAIAPGFLSAANISNVLEQSTILMMLALPMTLIIMTEGLDLSMGPALTLTSLFVAIVSLATGSPLIRLAAAVTVGLPPRTIASLLVSGFRTPPLS